MSLKIASSGRETLLYLHHSRAVLLPVRTSCMLLVGSSQLYHSACKLHLVCQEPSSAVTG